MVRFTLLCHMICENVVFLSFWYIKLFELGVEVTFYNGSAVAHNKIAKLIYSNTHVAMSVRFWYYRTAPPAAKPQRVIRAPH